MHAETGSAGSVENVFSFKVVYAEPFCFYFYFLTVGPFFLHHWFYFQCRRHVL